MEQHAPRFAPALRSVGARPKLLMNAVRARGVGACPNATNSQKDARQS